MIRQCGSARPPLRAIGSPNFIGDRSTARLLRARPLQVQELAQEGFAFAPIASSVQHQQLVSTSSTGWSSCRWIWMALAGSSVTIEAVSRLPRGRSARQH